MKAYGVFDGGGVKGAALAGCLLAAEEKGIEFVGYGGTSAGSIVAYLASLGYTGQELKAVMTQEIRFTDFLDDQGTSLNELRELPRKLACNRAKQLWVLWWNKKLLHRLMADFGLYRANPLRKFLLKKASEKIPALQALPDFTFNDLKSENRPLLKILASDISSRRPAVYSAAGGNETNGPVLDAVRASMSCPFVFLPVRVNDRFVVDGGLCSNLPIFLFEEERRADGLPVIAFDLVSLPPERAENYGMRQFCGDMLATALESGDYMQQRLLHGVYHVPVSVPPDIGTLDFSLTPQQCERLFLAGHSATHSFFSNVVPQWSQARNQVEALQALYAPAALVTPVLSAIAKEFESETQAKDVRSSVMLPTDHGTRIVVYQFGMDKDPDVDLELAMDAGCTGRTWLTKLPNFADLDEARSSFMRTWKMSQQQQNKVRADRKAMFAVPIFDSQVGSKMLKTNGLDLIGTLSIDTSTALEETLWVTTKQRFVLDNAKQWSDIIARILKQ